jgi:hypothetical protein
MNGSLSTSSENMSYSCHCTAGSWKSMEKVSCVFILSMDSRKRLSVMSETGAVG